MESATGILDATQSVTEQVEEDDIELIPESACIDAKLCEVMSSSCRRSRERFLCGPWNCPCCARKQAMDAHRYDYSGFC